MDPNYALQLLAWAATWSTIGYLARQQIAELDAKRRRDTREAGR